MRVISLSNASSLPIGGTEYTPGDDGVYELPEPLGVELTTKHASMWVAESAHLAAATAAEVERLRDPNILPITVADLLGRVAALEAKAAVSAKPRAPKAETPPATPLAGTEKAAKAATGKTASARKDAAKKTVAAKTAEVAPPASEPAETEPEQDGETPEAPVGEPAA